MFTGSIMDIFWETLCACARSLSICCPMLLNIRPVGEAVILDLTEEPSSIPEHANISITVTDTGYGMTPEFIKTIFEPFTRAENSTTNKYREQDWVWPSRKVSLT